MPKRSRSWGTRRRAASSEPSRRSVPPRVVRLRMPSQREEVAGIVDRVIEAVEGFGLPAGRQQDLAVAVSEALSNAAVHGNLLQPEALVEVGVEITPGDHVVVDVKDSGEGFDVSQITDPTEPRRLLVPAGRGVYLMHQLVDEVRYNARGNRVRLTMNHRKRRRSRRAAG